ncbi:MAG: hypothetical protein CME19_14435 [Gemmatimonadetes bacterium]|nr:hypothetical protein [Gemmatimonadota bacterium]
MQTLGRGQGGKGCRLWLAHHSVPVYRVDLEVCSREYRNSALMKHKQIKLSLPLVIPLILCVLGPGKAQAKPWTRHIIDDISSGADGVRILDVNGDGYVDITTGWEEGGITRVYVHPGPDRSKEPWPSVTVGQSPNVEDAVFCDVDGDGHLDVISSCEGKTRSMFVHWAPGEPDRYLDAEAWTTERIPATQGKRWMFAHPLDIDGQFGIDVVVSGKNQGAIIGWLQSPENPKHLSDWKLYPLYQAGWIMSLIGQDVDNDGDTDLVASDRRGDRSGVLWLERHTVGDTGLWREHRIGGDGREVMFSDLVDLDGDGRKDIVTAVKPREIQWYRCPEDPTSEWEVFTIRVGPEDRIGFAKAVAAGDLDGDGRQDLVFTCERAVPPRSGVVLLRYNDSPTEGEWTVTDIIGPDGIKFDRIELVDLDGDGDLDVLTCEEKHEGRGLGIFWLENPFNGSRR